MINDWNKNIDTFGAQDSMDIWGLIQNIEKYPLVKNEKDSGKWFVPSKAEWSAFGDYLYNKLGVDTGNYDAHGLSAVYWSSSQCYTDSVYDVFFNDNDINFDGYVNSWNIFYYRSNVRLSATF